MSRRLFFFNCLMTNLFVLFGEMKPGITPYFKPYGVDEWKHEVNILMLID